MTQLRSSRYAGADVASRKDQARRVADAIWRDERWRVAVICLASVGVAYLALFWQTVETMVATWYDSKTFNHGFLIVPICAYLVWIRREVLAKVKPQPEFWALPVVGFLSLVWLVGSVASVQMVQQFAFIGIIQCTVLVALGRRATRILAFPLFYLIFAVPFGEFLVPYLQDLTAVFVVEVLRFISIPVFLDGIFISIPTGNFEVAEACSGIRFLIATIALGVLFADLTYRSWGRRLAFVALSVIVPIVANGIRAFGIVYIAHMTDHKVAVGVDHIVYGWIFFAFVTVVLLAIGMTFRERDEYDREPTPETRPMPSVAASKKGYVVSTAVALLLAGVAPVYAVSLDLRTAPTITSDFAPPAGGNGWQRVATQDDLWKPIFEGADREYRTTYMKNGVPVTLYVAYYAWQRQGAEVIGAGNRITDGEHWARAASNRSFADVNGNTIDVKATRMIRAGRGRVALSWYWVDGQFTSDPIRAKFLEGRGKLLGHPRAAAAVIAVAPYEETATDAHRILKDFLGTIGPIGPALAKLTSR